MADVDSEELMAAMKQLSDSINNLIVMFKTASENIISEPDALKVVSKKLDRLVEQNEEIAKVLLLLLDVEKEHLPLITNNTRLSAEIRTPMHRHFSMRKPMQISPLKRMPIMPRPIKRQKRSGLMEQFVPTNTEPSGSLPERNMPPGSRIPDLELDLPEFETKQQKRRLFGK